MADAGTPNYRGDYLSESDYKRLFSFTSWAKYGDMSLPSTSKPGVGDPMQIATMYSNWLTGGKPAPIDPGVALAKSAALAGVYAKGGAGKGMGGLFGLGLILGGMTAAAPSQPGALGKSLVTPVGTAPPGSPMQSGVPYAVPPIPSLFKPMGR